jgi:hypothetical protein
MTRWQDYQKNNGQQQPSKTRWQSYLEQNPPEKKGSFLGGLQDISSRVPSAVSQIPNDFGKAVGALGSGMKTGVEMMAAPIVAPFTMFDTSKEGKQKAQAKSFEALGTLSGLVPGAGAVANVAKGAVGGTLFGASQAEEGKNPLQAVTSKEAATGGVMGAALGGVVSALGKLQALKSKAPVSKSPETPAKVIPESSITPKSSEPVSIPTRTGSLEFSTEPLKFNEAPIKTRATTLKPFKGTGETKVRGVSATTEAQAIEKNLTEGFTELPTYQQVNMVDQSSKAIAFRDANYESAYRVAMGQEKAPAGIIPEKIYNAVKNKAIQESDITTLQELANSKLSTEATTMGQRIKALDEVNPADPVKNIQAIQKTREQMAAKRYGDINQARTKITDDIKAEIRVRTPRVKEWSDFIDSIRCT